MGKLTTFIINYGVRFDRYSAYSSAIQTALEINAVCEFDTGVHRSPRVFAYFTLTLLFQLVGRQYIHVQFAGTSAVPPGSGSRTARSIAGAPTITI